MVGMLLYYYGTYNSGTSMMIFYHTILMLLVYM